MFDELLNPPTSVDRPALKVIAPIAKVVAPQPATSTGSPSSTTVDQDAPSPYNSQTTSETQSPVIFNDVEEENHDLDVAYMNNDPFFGIPIPENDSEASSSSDVIPTIMHTAALNSKSLQNGVVERRNHTLIEAARTMLIYEKAMLFLWAEAVATACYTQNRSIIRLRHDITPYELLHDKVPDLSFFHKFGALCYPTNDSENLGKLQPKADIGIFSGYAPTKKAFQIYNRCTRRIIKTIHVDFDELTVMASEHSNLEPPLHEMTPVRISSGLMPNPHPSTLFVPPSRTN
ncbi:retrovirus-related pol polyprotein from transposon TNT 1-94 [Tanacetum coccineum]